ncbi:MAG: MFS transporter [Williamsia sp.]|nr:MFS transporter [Williamsia sp.]
MTEFLLTAEPSRKAYRIAVGCLFFLMGICFATWASRIPTIQQTFHLTDSNLGLILLAIPTGSLLSLLFSGWLVTRFGSKRIVINAVLLYGILLVALGSAPTVPLLVAGLVLFGMAGNTANIAVNTQAVGVEAKYERNIMASFHGLWSLAGFTAAAIGTFMIGREIIPFYHFVYILGFMLAGIALSFQYLLPDEDKKKEKVPFFAMPDRPLFMLGVIAFCSMICEGAMFDWSGIYFQKVVHADEGLIGAGYTAFMCTMATGRFIADWIISRLGFQRTVRFSGLLIAAGLGIAVAFPTVISSIIGFLLVGFGVSSIVPLVYSEAGKTKKLSPGLALAVVSSIGFFGFLAGPPLIGIVAGISSLRVSFIIIAAMGISVALIVNKFKQTQQ